MCGVLICARDLLRTWMREINLYTSINGKNFGLYIYV